MLLRSTSRPLHSCNSNLRFASAVDKGADRIVSSCPTDVQVSPVPWLN